MYLQIIKKMKRITAGILQRKCFLAKQKMLGLCGIIRATAGIAIASLPPFA